MTGRRGLRLLGAGALVATCWFMTGIVGALAALGGLALAARAGYRAVAGAALGCLLVTAVFTLVEAPATGLAYNFDFTNDRPLAALAGRVAGALVLVAAVLAAAREREGAPEPDGA